MLAKYICGLWIFVVLRIYTIRHQKVTCTHYSENWLVDEYPEAKSKCLFEASCKLAGCEA